MQVFLKEKPNDSEKFKVVDKVRKIESLYFIFRFHKTGERDLRSYNILRSNIFNFDFWNINKAH